MPSRSSVSALWDRSIPKEIISLVPRRATARGVFSPSRYLGLKTEVRSPSTERRVSPINTWYSTMKTGICRINGRQELNGLMLCSW